MQPESPAQPDNGAMKFLIRAAREEDAKSMVALLNAIIREGRYTIMDSQISVDDQISFIRSFPEQGVFNVAVCSDTGRMLGIQDIMPLPETSAAFRHIGEISTFVAPEFHGKGIGRGLCNATLRTAAEHGFMKIMANIRADNPGAIAFYLRQGFRLIGTARNHALFRGRYIDEILAEKLIN